MKLVERRKWAAEGNKTWKEENKPFYLKRWSNWMKSLIKAERRDQYKLTMMVSLRLSLAH
jgi:hypothetical protein